MVKLDIRNLLTGPPNRLRYTFRYSTCRISHPESVAEHSYYVCLYSLAMADWLEASRQPLSPMPYAAIAIRRGELLQRAVLHDLEECVSGDFPRTFKYSDPQTKDTLDHMAEIAMRQVTGAVFPGKDRASEVVRDAWKDVWLDSKDHTVEGRIVNVADFLCVLGFMNDEADAIRLQHVSVLEGYYRLFQKPEFDFLRPILDQAGELLQEISGGSKKESPSEILDQARTEHLKGDADSGGSELERPTGNRKDEPNEDWREGAA